MDRFTAIAEPTRRRIVELLGADERTAGEISRRFSVSPSAISQHLRTLREAGLLQVRTDGQRRIYSLDPKGFSEMDAWFERMRGYWSLSLDRLEQELQGERG